MTKWKQTGDYPKGSYTDEHGNVHEVTIICDHPAFTFRFDGPIRFEPDTWRLDSVETDGCTFDNAPMGFYQDIIDFCQDRIKKIPHYEVNGDKLEWVNEREEEKENED